MGLNAAVAIQAIRGRLCEDVGACVSGQFFLVFPEEDHQCLPGRRKERAGHLVL